MIVSATEEPRSTLIPSLIFAMIVIVDAECALAQQTLTAPDAILGRIKEFYKEANVYARMVFMMIILINVLNAIILVKLALEMALQCAYLAS